MHIYVLDMYIIHIHIHIVIDSDKVSSKYLFCKKQSTGCRCAE